MTKEEWIARYKYNNVRSISTTKEEAVEMEAREIPGNRVDYVETVYVLGPDGNPKATTKTHYLTETQYFPKIRIGYTMDPTTGGFLKLVPPTDEEAEEAWLASQQ